MIHHLPITEARRNLGSLVKRLHRTGGYFILEKDGIPVAAIMGVDELDDYLDMRDPKVKKAIDQSRKDYQAGRTRPAEELLAELKKEQPPAGRSRRQ